MDIQVPSGYKITEADPNYNARGQLQNIETGESFLLSNRRWNSINRYFADMPRQIIKRLLLTATPNVPARILDVGAGEQFKAANELQQKYKRKSDKLQVIGVDLTAATDTPSTTDRLRGDALHLPLKDESIDLAYSRQSLVYITDDDPALLRQGFSEIARVLSPGGILFIDYDNHPRFKEGDSRLEKVAPEGTLLYSGKQGSLVSPVVRVIDALSGRSYNFEFLALVKGGPAPEVSPLTANGQLNLLIDNRSPAITGA